MYYGELENRECCKNMVACGGVSVKQWGKKSEPEVTLNCNKFPLR